MGNAQFRLDQLPIAARPKGFVAKIPIESADKIAAFLNSEEHWPTVWADIYTGDSLNKKWTDLFGNVVTDADIREATNIPGSFQEGVAQSYGKHFTDLKTFPATDFVRLTDITSIKTRITTDTGSGGTCNITAQNVLQLRDYGGGTTSWERVQYKDGRFADGQYIQYYSPSQPPYWFRGKLEKVTENYQVKLDDQYFNIKWDPVTGTPPNIIANHFFVEQMGETLLEPMNKIKIFAVSRIPYNILDPNYYSLFQPDSGISEEFKNSADIAKTGRVACSIFTGFLSDVSHRNQGADWSISITAKDVTCWLDYSFINLNPSLNIWGRDIVSTAFSLDWPIFTTRFENMAADEVVKSIFIGGTQGRVTNTDLFVDPGLKKKITVLKAQEVTVYTFEPEGADAVYVVTLSGNNQGWVSASAVTRKGSVYTGLGGFRPDKDPKLTLYPVDAEPVYYRKNIISDRIIVYSAAEPESKTDEDDKVLIAYQKYMRQSWPTVQSEYRSKRGILSEVCKMVNCECYADGDGRVWFHPVWAYHSVDDPVYIIHRDEVTSWEFTYSDREVVTWLKVAGQFPFDVTPLGTRWGQAFEDAGMCGKFGLRGTQLSNPNLKSDEACVAFAESMIKRINANIKTGLVTLIMRPELQLARNVYIPFLNLVGYISSIDHNYQPGRTATTSLSLKYVRHPWEPWRPIDYAPDAPLYSGEYNQDQKSVTTLSFGTDPRTGLEMQTTKKSFGSTATREATTITSTRPIETEAERDAAISAMASVALARVGDLVQNACFDEGYIITSWNIEKRNSTVYVITPVIMQGATNITKNPKVFKILEQALKGQASLLAQSHLTVKRWLDSVKQTPAIDDSLKTVRFKTPDTNLNNGHVLVTYVGYK